MTPLVNVFEIVNPTLSYQKPVKRLLGQFSIEKAEEMGAISHEHPHPTKESFTWKMWEPMPEVKMIVDAGNARHETSHLPNGVEANISLLVAEDNNVSIDSIGFKMPEDHVFVINGNPPPEEKVALVGLLKANPTNKVIWHYKIPQEKVSFGRGFALMSLDHPGVRPTTFNGALTYVDALKNLFTESQGMTCPVFDIPPVAARRMRNDFAKAKAAISLEYQTWLRWISEYGSAKAKDIPAPAMPFSETKTFESNAAVVAHELEAMLEKSVQRLLAKSEYSEANKAKEVANALLRAEEPLHHETRTVTRKVTVKSTMRCRNHASSPAQSYMRK